MKRTVTISLTFHCQTLCHSGDYACAIGITLGDGGAAGGCLSFMTVLVASQGFTLLHPGSPWFTQLRTPHPPDSTDSLGNGTAPEDYPLTIPVVALAWRGGTNWRREAPT